MKNQVTFFDPVVVDTWDLFLYFDANHKQARDLAACFINTMCCDVEFHRLHSVQEHFFEIFDTRFRKTIFIDRIRVHMRKPRFVHNGLFPELLNFKGELDLRKLVQIDDYSYPGVKKVFE